VLARVLTLGFAFAFVLALALTLAFVLALALALALALGAAAAAFFAGFFAATVPAAFVDAALAAPSAASVARPGTATGFSAAGRAGAWVWPSTAASGRICASTMSVTFLKISLIAPTPRTVRSLPCAL